MSKIYKRDDSPYYYYTARYKGRRIKKATGLTKKHLAEKVKDHWDLMIAKGDLSFLGRNTTTAITTVKSYFSQHIAFLSTRKSENTYTTTEGVLNQFQAYLEGRGVSELDQITLKLVDGYLDHLDRAPKTKKNHLTVLRVMFNQAVHEGLISSNPASHATLPEMTKNEIHRLLAPEEIQLIFQNAGKWKMYYAFLLYTGLRAGDVAMLKYGNIDLKQRTITVEIRKSRRTHALPLAEVLVEFLDENAKPATPLFPDLYRENTTRLCDRFYRARIHLQHILVDHGNPKATLHSFRVTYNNMLRDQGLSIQDRQVLLAHTASETTKIYTHPNLELAKEHINRLPNLLKQRVEGTSDE
ncbi:tyrosine-type recombinase/integrase [Candidatus Neomarinimicrobiota bacterium]